MSCAAVVTVTGAGRIGGGVGAAAGEQLGRSDSRNFVGHSIYSH